jgi:hypothetical protein
MNFRRILAFVGILFVATAAAAFPFGFIRGHFLATGHSTPHWTIVGQALAVPLAAIAVIAALAKREVVRPWAHAWIVVIVAWLFSFPLNVMLLRQPWLAWLRDLIALCVMVSIAVPLGVHLRRLSSATPRSNTDTREMPNQRLERPVTANRDAP